MCTEYLGEETQTRGTLGVGGWGQDWGDFTVFLLYPLNVVLCVHFDSKGKLKSFRKPPEEAES